MFTFFICFSVYRPYDQKLMQYTAHYFLKRTLNRVKTTKKKKIENKKMNKY